MRLFSHIISGMFHPLLMVTYGVVLALTFTYLAIYPPAMKLLLAGGAFLSTAVIPGAFIFMMVKNGAAVDMELSDRHERVVPYLIFITSIMVCAFYMYKMMLPFWFISLLLGACVALIMALLINFFWKISAHAIGTGGLLGGIMGVARHPFDKPLLGLYHRNPNSRIGRYFAYLSEKTYSYAGICRVLSRIYMYLCSLILELYLFIHLIKTLKL